MAVSFNNIPANIRVPLFYAEVDNSMANTATADKKSLIIGQADYYALKDLLIRNFCILNSH